ncbi:PDZ domain-containing protein [Candidatus Falkowbacteria bacterium]|uniref:PDZ domain-containing protein n=1 Tax=Candidatus Falkowbacteria bacterium CG10_big_fil_rev_8_21_14_0_10_37_18 TaxID=1974562 RepID=A0A2H0V820_9BACT|nr:PDZ domain-containing protein [Candidatus Falkowbacteria bacterium]NCQ12817.1 PDZ domain-containing protein [Candidatus Falkowbacteria bacterium]OIO06382.1 MAG: hypothetical protein AUJ26_00790 [Candidatus Falkowbacteria bacterium CG1_02_37_21]PIR95211.1 MAG: hypothetical protein COT93_03665 [Candidatus Falkowbacteria bacterium CG10_big_fil_rev_8_21_14_0_10_37_18]
MSNSSSLVSKHFYLTISVAVLCGLAAGILGEIVTRVYILQDFVAPYGNINLSDLGTNNPGLIIRDAKQVVVNQDLKVAETVNNVQPLLLGIFKEISAEEGDDIIGYYDLDSPLAVGLVITADGWVAAPTSPILSEAFKFKNYVVIANDHRLYKIDKMATSSDGVLLMHLAGTTSWSVKKIMTRADFVLGGTLIDVPGSNTVWPTTLSAWSRETSVLSSESLGAHLVLAGGDKGEFNNSFVFNLAGDLAAIVTDNGKIIPAFSYAPVWSTLSQLDSSGRPLLGVNYLDLSAVKIGTTTADKGNLLYASASQPAVKKNSPADIAGLEAGDIITWVNNQEVDATHDLANILAFYHAGDEVTITYKRDGVEKEVKITLGQLK